MSGNRLHRIIKKIRILMAFRTGHPNMKHGSGLNKPAVKLGCRLPAV